MIKTSWAYSLKKEDLIKYLGQYQQDSAGTVEELRKRFAKFLAAEHEKEQLQELLELQSKHEAYATGSQATLPVDTRSLLALSPGKTDPNKGMSVTHPSFSSTALTQKTNPNIIPSTSGEERVQIIETVRKWGIKYNGGRDPLEFIERLEELADMYNVDLDQLPRVMPEVFRERALIWYRNNNRHWKSWRSFKEDFHAFFLPPRYFEKLEDEIRKRVQRPRESFKDYVLALQDLMRPTSFTEEQKLERIFRNAQSDYQWYIRRKDFSTLEELIQLADDRDCIPVSSNQQRGEQHRMVTGKQRKDEQSRVSPGKTRLVTPRPMKEARLIWEEDKIKAVILLEGQLQSAIIDTGATRSFISPRQARKLNRKLFAVSIDVFLADGTQKTVTKAVRVWITLGQIRAQQELLIMEGATENLILGLDFLQHFGTTVSCAGLVARSGSAGNTPNAEAKQVRKNKRQVNATNYPSETERHLQNSQKCNNVTNPSQIAKSIMKSDRPSKLSCAVSNPKRCSNFTTIRNQHYKYAPLRSKDDQAQPEAAAISPVSHTTAAEPPATPGRGWLPQFSQASPSLSLLTNSMTASPKPATVSPYKARTPVTPKSCAEAEVKEMTPGVSTRPTPLSSPLSLTTSSPYIISSSNTPSSSSRSTAKDEANIPTTPKRYAESAVENLTSVASIRPPPWSLSSTPLSSNTSSSTSPYTATSVWARECSPGGPKGNAMSYTPPVPSSPLNLQYAQVPEELQQAIEEARKQRCNNQRVRFRYSVYQQEYQVTITRTGTLQIQWRRP